MARYSLGPPASVWLRHHSTSLGSYSNVASVEYRSEKIFVYPNPVSDHLTLISPKDENVIVLNHLSQILDNYHLEAGENTLDVSTYEAGIYLLKFSGGQMQRVIKN